jgi:hypothetical protein
VEGDGGVKSMGPGIACPFEISGYADSILVDYAMAHRAIAYCRRVAEGRREDNRAGGPFHEMMTFQSANGTSSRQPPLLGPIRWRVGYDYLKVP